MLLRIIFVIELLLGYIWMLFAVHPSVLIIGVFLYFLPVFLGLMATSIWFYFKRPETRKMALRVFLTPIVLFLLPIPLYHIGMLLGFESYYYFLGPIIIFGMICLYFPKKVAHYIPNILIKNPLFNLLLIALQIFLYLVALYYLVHPYVSHNRLEVSALITAPPSVIIFIYCYLGFFQTDIRRSRILRGILLILTLPILLLGVEAYRHWEKEDSYKRQLASIKEAAEADGVKAIPKIEEALLDSDPLIRKQAIESLGVIGGEQAVTLLTQILNDSEISDRGSALRSLAKIDEDAVMPYLSKAIYDSDLRHVAFDIISKIESKYSIELIEQGLNSNRVTANLAAGALNHRILIKTFSAAESSALIEKAFESEYANVRTKAAYYLHILEMEKAFILFDKAMDDKDYRVKESAVRSIVHFNIEYTRDRLITFLHRIDKNRLKAWTVFYRKHLPNDPEVEEIFMAVGQ